MTNWWLLQRTAWLWVKFTHNLKDFLSLAQVPAKFLLSQGLTDIPTFILGFFKFNFRMLTQEFQLCPTFFLRFFVNLAPKQDPWALIGSPQQFTHSTSANPQPESSAHYIRMCFLWAVLYGFVQSWNCIRAVKTLFYVSRSMPFSFRLGLMPCHMHACLNESKSVLCATFS